MRTFPLLVLSLVLLVGCPTTPANDDTGPLTFPDCEAIIEACHMVDDGSPGPLHDCHETAHDAASNAECAPVRAMCVMTCESVDGGGRDGGGTDEDAGT